MKYIWTAIMLLSLLRLYGQTDLTKSQRPPGVQIAQINLYKVDGLFYDLTYYDPNEFKDTDEVHYNLFKRYVMNNESYLIDMWIDQIRVELPEGSPKMPDSTYNKIMQWYWRNGKNK